MTVKNEIKDPKTMMIGGKEKCGNAGNRISHAKNATQMCLKHTHYAKIPHIGSGFAGENLKFQFYRLPTT